MSTTFFIFYLLNQTYDFGSFKEIVYLLTLFCVSFILCIYYNIIFYKNQVVILHEIAGARPLDPCDICLLTKYAICGIMRNSTRSRLVARRQNSNKKTGQLTLYFLCVRWRLSGRLGRILGAPSARWSPTSGAPIGYFIRLRLLRWIFHNYHLS